MLNEKCELYFRNRIKNHISLYELIMGNVASRMGNEGKYSRHEVLLEKNDLNESLCKKLLTADYISSYDIKKEKNGLFKDDVEKYVARVKAKR